jgi:hypothetical protein
VPTQIGVFLAQIYVRGDSTTDDEYASLCQIRAGIAAYVILHSVTLPVDFGAQTRSWVRGHQRVRGDDCSLSDTTCAWR